MTQGNCKLCRNSRDLCESHIIPNFVFRYIKRYDKQIIADLNQKPKAFYHDNSFKEYLLCKDCEKTIKIFEDYVRDFIFDYKRIGITKNETRDRIYYKNIDYQKYKKYLLSILWRASISSDQMFSKIKLIEEDEDKIQSILMNLDACEPYFYGCDIIEFYDVNMEKLNQKIDYKTILMQPFLDKSKNIFFVYAGYIWKYYLNATLISNKKTNMLNTSGNMIVLKKSIHEYPRLFNIFKYAILNCEKVGKFGKNR